MEDHKQPRRKLSATEISGILRRYRQSGKNRQEFCDLEGISYSSLGNWLRAKKQLKEKFSKTKSGKFISLDLAGLASAAPLMQISFPAGCTISFFTQPLAGFIKELLP